MVIRAVRPKQTRAAVEPERLESANRYRYSAQHSQEGFPAYETGCLLLVVNGRIFQFAEDRDGWGRGSRPIGLGSQADQPTTAQISLPMPTVQPPIRQQPIQPGFSPKPARRPKQRFVLQDPAPSPSPSPSSTQDPRSPGGRLFPN